MGKVLVEEFNLSSIASAIRTKLGSSGGYKPSEMAAAINAIDTSGITPTGSISITENGTVDVTQYASAAVNVPNSYVAGDEGKVVSNGALVAQTARSSQITQNGTYDTTENNSVTVNVQSSGVYGFINDMSLLPYSQNILVSVKASAPAFQNAGLSVERYSNDEYTLGMYDTIVYDLPSANHDVTVYYIAKSKYIDSGDHMIVHSPYAQSYRNSPGFFARGSTLMTTVWSNDTSCEKAATDWNLMVYSLNNTSKIAGFYVNGVKNTTKEFYNSGNNVIINRHMVNAGDRTNIQAIRFIGIVDGCESDETIIQNSQNLMSYFSDIFGA